MDPQQDQLNPPKKRPELLTILCILSFIFGGLALLTYLTASLNFQEFRDALNNMNMDLPQFDALKKANQGFYLMGAILYAASLFGAIQMWQLRKSGFHFYLMAQLLIILHPYIFLKISGFPLLQIISTGIFIYLYSRHLKYMT